MPLRLTARRPPATRPARLSDAPLAPLDDVHHVWPGTTVAAGPYRVHVRDTPPLTGGPLTDGLEPALLVHGLAGSSGNWTDLAGLLRCHVHARAIDLPGFGRSEPPPRDDYTLDSHARAVIAYLDAQAGDPSGWRGGAAGRPEPVHLVSNSMGGAISILVAARRPDLVRTLTLISPAVPDNALRVHPLRHDWRLGLVVLPYLGAASLRRMAALPVETRVRATVRMVFADPSRLPERRFREMVEDTEARVGLPWADRALIRSTRALARSQLLQNRRGWSVLRSVRAPSLVLWGDTDRLVAPDLAPYVAGAIPDARLRVFQNVGHTAMLEDPEATARAVVALLEDARQPGTDAPGPR